MRKMILAVVALALFATVAMAGPSAEFAPAATWIGDFDTAQSDYPWRCELEYSQCMRRCAWVPIPEGCEATCEIRRELCYEILIPFGLPI